MSLLQSPFHRGQSNLSRYPCRKDTIILEKSGALMVDNEKFEILRSNATEAFALFRDPMNLITVVLNYQYGTLLYSKVFTNVGFGKQNAMSFVATCRNY